MNREMQERLRHLYPELAKNNKEMILIDKETYDAYMTGPVVKIGIRVISIKMLHALLSNSFAFEYVVRCVNKNIPYFGVMCIDDGKSLGSIRFTRVEFVRNIEKAIEAGQLTLNYEELSRFELIRSRLTYSAFKSEQTDTFPIDIDGMHYEFSTTFLMRFAEMSDEEFKEICADYTLQAISGYPKEYIFYAVLKFFDNGRLNDYLFPEAIRRRILDIKNNRYIDVEAINRYNLTEDDNSLNVEISPSLRNAVLRDMPKNYNKMQQAIYIYIMMCKILTYDEEFYAVNQEGPLTLKHRQINYIKKITPENNRVVCYEFNAIYAKFLELIGINYAIKYGGTDKEYGKGHEALEWRYHKFLVNADSSFTLMGNDMMQAKLNQPLQGLTCMNLNRQTCIDFNRIVSSVYKDIALKENPYLKDIESVESLDDLVLEYLNRTINVRRVSLTEKIDILFSKLNKVRLKGLDLLAYMVQLRTIIFDKNEQRNNITITIIRDNSIQDHAKPIAIIVINMDSLVNNASENEYFIYDSEHNLACIDVDELQDKFDSNSLEYIKEDTNHEISGIVRRGV